MEQLRPVILHALSNYNCAQSRVNISLQNQVGSPGPLNRSLFLMAILHRGQRNFRGGFYGNFPFH